MDRADFSTGLKSDMIAFRLLLFSQIFIILTKSQSSFQVRTTCANSIENNCTSTFIEQTFFFNQCYQICDGCNQTQCLFRKYSLSGNEITTLIYAPFDSSCSGPIFQTMIGSHSCDGLCRANPAIIGTCPVCMNVPLYLHLRYFAPN